MSQAGIKVPLTSAAWIADFQDFVLAAAAANMWSFVASYTHLRHCMRIACEARLEQRSWHLALLYDEIARKTWSEKTMRGKLNFSQEIQHACMLSSVS